MSIFLVEFDDEEFLMLQKAAAVLGRPMSGCIKTFALEHAEEVLETAKMLDDIEKDQRTLEEYEKSEKDAMFQ